MLAHYKVLLYVAVIAAIAITFDALLESDFLDSLRPRSSYLDRSLVALWKDYQAGTFHDQALQPPFELEEHYAIIPLNHEEPHSDTYYNRYWVSTEHYSRGGPVIVHDVGEVDAEPSAKKFLAQPTSYLQQLLKEYHGIGVVWEHRYYGNSLPLAIDQTSEPGEFRFLNLNQSLADLPYFAWNFSLPSHSDLDLTPASTPWIMVGCSYSGMRAALSRSRYPETFYAAYAASAPVQLRVKLDKFFDPVYEKMVDRGYESCAQDLHAAMQYLDIRLSDPSSVSLIKQQVLGPGAEVNGNGDFTLAVANIYSYFQSHGLEGGPRGLRSLCDYLDHDENSTGIQGKKGLAARYGGQYVLEKLAVWPHLITIVNNHFNTTCSGSNASEATVCDLAIPATHIGEISWTWQLCSELGLYTTQNTGPHSLVSQYLSLEYRQSLCHKQFPQAFAENILSAIPAAEAITQQTGGRSMRPSNVFWTAGQYDPWRTLTPLAIEELANVTVSQRVPVSNISTGANTIFGYVLQDAQHCLDYDMNAKEANTARTLFASALREWLPAFEGSRRSR